MINLEKRVLHVVLTYLLKMTNKRVYKLSKDVLIRYEESIDSGTFFIFNVVSEELWCGNKSSRFLVGLIDEKNNTEEIKEKLGSILGVGLSVDLSISVDNILTELLEKRMIVLE